MYTKHIHVHVFVNLENIGQFNVQHVGRFVGSYAISVFGQCVRIRQDRFISASVISGAEIVDPYGALEFTVCFRQFK